MFRPTHLQLMANRVMMQVMPGRPIRKYTQNKSINENILHKFLCLQDVQADAVQGDGSTIYAAEPDAEVAIGNEKKINVQMQNC